MEALLRGDGQFGSEALIVDDLILAISMVS